MKAELKPLETKYYGTMLEITEGPLKDLCFKLWKCTGTPSDRELEKYKITREQWDNNLKVECDWLGEIAVRDLDITCDSHYESQEVYQLAKRLVEFLNTLDCEKLK